MKVQSNTRPNPLTIKVTDKAILIFSENITVEETEDGVLYSYDEYRLTVPLSATLEKRVTDNFDTWLVKAKQEEYDNLAETVRAERNRRLAETDYLFLADQGQSDEIKAYRQALRDLTKQEGFPYKIIWPEI